MWAIFKPLYALLLWFAIHPRLSLVLGTLLVGVLVQQHLFPVRLDNITGDERDAQPDELPHPGQLSPLGGWLMYPLYSATNLLIAPSPRNTVYQWAWVVLVGSSSLYGLFRAGEVIVLNLRFLVTQFIRRPHNLRKRYGAGAWAVVTGGSDGIGRGFAVELAKDGFSICLISRDIDKLRDAELEILATAEAAGHRVEWPQGRRSVEVTSEGAPLSESASTPTTPTAPRVVVRTKLVVADFSKASSEGFWDRMRESLGDLGGNVAFLVNNVGVNCTDEFSEFQDSFLQDVANVNCLTQMMMTKIMIPMFESRIEQFRRVRDGEVSKPFDSACFPVVERTAPLTLCTSTAGPAIRCAVITMSSVVGMRPVLFIGPYCASKAFNDYLSRSLDLEYRSKGIDFISLRAGYVMTNMSQLKEKSAFVLDRYECARGCLEKLGYVSETYGDPRHAVYARSYLYMPEMALALRRKQRLLFKKSADEGDAASPTSTGVNGN